MKKVLIISIYSILIALVLYSVYPRNSIRDNQVYPAEDFVPSNDIVRIASNIKDRGKNNFYDIEKYTDKLQQGEIFITVSKDKKTIFYMTPSTDEESNKSVVLKGPTSQVVNLYAKDLSTDKSTVIASNIPFITSSSLNREGNLVFFKGSDQILLYDIHNKKLLMGKELSKVKIETASWSRDGKKLYLQYHNIPNGAVIYADSLKLVESYELPDEVFYKDAFNEESYFGVIQNLNSRNTLLSNCSSALLNNQGERLKDLGQGIYADSFEKSLLIKNLNNTYDYIPDFTSSTKAIKLSDKLIYDAGFLYDGSLYYITEAEAKLNNRFILHRIINEGKEIHSFEVSGSSMLLLANGRHGYINGPDLELVSFEDNTVLKSSPTASIDTEIISSLRGALEDFRLNANEGKSMKSSSYFTDAAAHTIDSLLAELNSSLSQSYISLYKSLNPKGRAVINNFKQINESTWEAELSITIRSYWTNDFKGNYKITISKDKDHWKVSSFSIK